MSKEAKEAKLLNIPLADIDESEVALRTVQKDSEGYEQLLDSVRAKGILNAINVRNGENGRYIVTDGLHRLTAARDAGLKTIPAVVLDANDMEVLEIQIIGNLQKTETKPSEYAAQLKRMFAKNPLMTEPDMADKLKCSITWIRNRLSLNKIVDPNIIELMDTGKIPIANSYALAKLPPDEQINFVDKAQTESPQQFVPRVNERVKEIRDANRQGKDPKKTEFTPVEFLQKLNVIREERNNLQRITHLLNIAGISDPKEGARMALNWVLNSDPESIDKQRQDWEENERKKKEKIEQRKREREELKARLEAEKSEEIMDHAAEIAVGAKT